MIDHVSDQALSVHLDGALDGPDERLVADHIRTCAGCAHRLELLGATARAISELADEQPPVPLDLAFLAAPVTPSPGNVPKPGRWRPPAWAAPVLAAAAILLAAVTLGPGLLPRGNPTATSSQAGGSNDRYAPVPFAATAGRRATQAFAQWGGAVIELSASEPSPRIGQQLTMNLRIHAGSTALQARRSSVRVNHDSASQQVAAAGSETVSPENATSLSGSWEAGKVGSAPEARGDYQVVGQVILSDGSELSVSFTIHVS